jgi:hypothetical protein
MKFEMKLERSLYVVTVTHSGGTRNNPQLATIEVQQGEEAELGNLQLVTATHSGGQRKNLQLATIEVQRREEAEPGNLQLVTATHSSETTDVSYLLT